MRRLALLVTLVGVVACTSAPDRSPAATTAPDSFRVAFQTSRGPFVVEVHRAWAPRGADRLYALATEHFFDDERFFRVLPGFIAQFGASGDKSLNARWDKRTMQDDPPGQHNTRGTISFAQNGPNTRAHQLFINLKDNASLDAQGFVPIGRVVAGMSAVDSIYGAYGETPRYHLIATLGNNYLTRMFPKMDFIETARIENAAPAR